MHYIRRYKIEVPLFTGLLQNYHLSPHAFKLLTSLVAESFQAAFSCVYIAETVLCTPQAACEAFYHLGLWLVPTTK